MNQYEIKRKEQDSPSKFYVRPNSSDWKSIRDVFKNNAYQRKEFTIGSGEKWLDLGANVGAFSVFVSSLGNSVISFEGDESNFKACLKNLALNNSPAIVKNCAVVEDSFLGDTITFFSSDPEGPGNQWRNSTFEPSSRPSVKSTVPILKFSDLESTGFDCLKIDIEGSEIQILEERPDMSWVNKMALEWSFDKFPSINKALEVLEFLKENFSYVDIDRDLERAKSYSPDGDTYSFFPPCMMIYCKK